MSIDQSQSSTGKHRWRRMAIGAFVLVAVLGACIGPGQWRSWKAQQKRELGIAMWQERCKAKSGVYIHRTVENVEGIYLVNVRKSPEHRNLGEREEDQFRLSDPYGSDGTDDGYIMSFLRDNAHYDKKEPVPEGFPPLKGYLFVEAIDPKDGKLLNRPGYRGGQLL